MPWTGDPLVIAALERIAGGTDLEREDLLALLALDPASSGADQLRMAANQLTRSRAGTEGMIGAQVGVDAGPCSGACAFCAFSAKHGDLTESWQIPDGVLVTQVRDMVEAGANYISLMCTADFPFAEFLRLSRLARSVMPDGMLLSANVGDFDLDQAHALRAVGYGRVYHVLRLGEGVCTDLDPEVRRVTLRAAEEAGLEIAFCIEPIGSEHTDGELVDRILLSREVRPTMAAVMRRIPLPGGPFADSAVVSELRMAQIMAVTRLAHAHGRALTFYIHEPSLLGLCAGANLICAERAGNPREGNTTVATERGFSVHRCRAMLTEAGYRLRAAPNYPGSWFPGFSPASTESNS